MDRGRSPGREDWLQHYKHMIRRSLPPDLARWVPWFDTMAGTFFLMGPFHLHFSIFSFLLFFDLWFGRKSRFQYTISLNQGVHFPSCMFFCSRRLITNQHAVRMHPDAISGYHRIEYYLGYILIAWLTWGTFPIPLLMRHSSSSFSMRWISYVYV